MNMKKISLLALLFIVSVFASSQVVEKDGVFCDGSGNPYSGSYTQKNSDGSNLRLLNIESGLLHGEVIFYSSTGAVEEKGHYTNGKKSGVWHQFNSKGSVIGEAFYKEGLKDGIWTVWDDMGVKRYHMVYSLGKKVDVWKMWDENSVLVSERLYGE